MRGSSRARRSPRDAPARARQAVGLHGLTFIRPVRGTCYPRALGDRAHGDGTRHGAGDVHEDPLREPDGDLRLPHLCNQCRERAGGRRSARSNAWATRTRPVKEVEHGWLCKRTCATAPQAMIVPRAQTLPSGKRDEPGRLSDRWLDLNDRSRGGKALARL